MIRHNVNYIEAVELGSVTSYPDNGIKYGRDGFENEAIADYDM